MYWFNKQDLLYYHPNTGGYCYCELLVEPSDLTLQAHVPPVKEGANLYIDAYTPDGETLIAEVTALFKGIIATDTSGSYYVNLQLQSFGALLCDSCFVLRVRVVSRTGSVTVFDKFTQQYCIADCCSATGELIATSENSPEREVFNDATESIYFDNCGQPIVRIKSTFPCFDNFTNDYYGAAITKIEGVNNLAMVDYVFYKVTNLPGLFKRTPREVKTIISLNCKTQKTEGTRRWMLQGSTPVPSWKMDEMEGQLSAYTITVNGKEYKMETGTPFIKIQPYQKESVAEYFRLDTLLYECRIWQVFGCGTTCLTTQRTGFATLKQGQALYKVFDENGAPIAFTQADFITYLLSQEGITAVEDVSYVYTSYGYSSVLMITSDNGYIPSYFYLNSVGANSKWYMVSEVADLFSGCVPATFGTITDAAAVCPSAVIGTTSDVAASTLSGTVLSFGDWAVQAGSTLTKTGPTVRLSFVSRNVLLANSQAAVGGDIVGYVSWEFVPSEERTLTANLPADTYVTVGTDGTLRWFGALTNVTPMYGEIEFINVTYNI